MRRANRKTPRKHSQVTLFCLLLAAVVVSLYANTLSHGFVFDDVTLIQQNTDVTQLNWGRILGRTGYRPGRTFTYALNYALGGTDPFGYHLLNLLLHAANSVLTFLLLRSILGRVDASFLGAMLFAVHPVQTASVAYISGRKDLLAGFFVLLASILYIGWRRRGGWQRLALTILSLLLAVLSKEVAVVFPALFVLLDACGSEGRFRPSEGSGLIAWFATSVGLYAVLAALAAAAVYYAVIWTEASRMVGYWGGSLTAQWATSFKLFVHYLQLALSPYPLLADYTGVFPVSTGFTEPATLICLLLSVAYLALALLVWRRWPEVTLGMGWFLVCLLPVLQIVGVHEIAADHFLYLPMFGVALVFGYVGAQAAASRHTDVLAWTFLFAVVSLSGLLTVSRNRVWADELTLWEDTYEKAPQSYRANANLGQLYFARFERDPNRDPQLREWAIQLSEQAAELNPEDSLPLSNLGAIYRKWGLDEYLRGNTDRAEELERHGLSYLSGAVSLDPENVWALSNLGDVRKDLALIWARRGNLVQAETERLLAIEFLERAIAIGSPKPQFPMVYFNLAMVKVDQGKFPEALFLLKKAADAPDAANVWEFSYWMGYCYLATTGSVSDAIPHLRQAVRIRPSYPPGLRLLGYSLDGIGESDEAVALYQRALRVAPASYETHYLLGTALQGQEKHTIALQHMMRARELVEEAPETSSREAYRRSIEKELQQFRNHAEGVTTGQ